MGRDNKGEKDGLNFEGDQCWEGTQVEESLDHTLGHHTFDFVHSQRFRASQNSSNGPIKLKWSIQRNLWTMVFSLHKSSFRLHSDMYWRLLCIVDFGYLYLLFYVAPSLFWICIGFLARFYCFCLRTWPIGH